MPKHVVEQGECISSIAADAGFAPDTIWNHPENAQLKNQRKDRNILYPGDVVFVPDKEIRYEPRATGARHQFVRKGVPEFLSLRFMNEEEPRAGEEYLLKIDDTRISGKLDSTGSLQVPIPPGSRSATLILGDPTRGEQYQLSLGHLDPVKEISGVEGRLYNLGYLKTPPTGEESPELADAVKMFQQDNKLPADKGLDDSTRQKLVEIHGS
jgi:N-acetylmuramoyl-L-alanine amidase